MFLDAVLDEDGNPVFNDQQNNVVEWLKQNKEKIDPSKHLVYIGTKGKIVTIEYYLKRWVDG